MEEKFFSIDEVSRYLNIPKSTIYKLSQRKEIPSLKIGKQVRFRKTSLDKWLNEKESCIHRYKFPVSNSKRLLLVDDDPLVLKALAKLLKSNGYNVEPVESGEEALRKAETVDFDLLVVDVRMSGIDGIETIKRIRALCSGRNKPFVPEIVITGYMDTSKQVEAEKLGITDYIYKPFILNEFIQTIGHKLDRKAESN